MQSQKLAVVTGAGGFIGGHLVAEFRKQGYKHIRAVGRLSHSTNGISASTTSKIFASTSTSKKTAISPRTAPTKSTISPRTWAAWASSNRTKRSACCRCSSIRTCCRLRWITAARSFSTLRRPASITRDKQKTFEAPSLKEEDAYPAQAEDGYGWEKLFSERMCRHFREDFGLYTRVARFHNVYGPWGTWDGGREKAPAAICRKVIEAKVHGKHEIEIWGSGEQTRSFMFTDDCVKGIQLITNSQILEPINLGSTEAVSINQLVDIVEGIAGIKLKRNYDLSAPKGVNGRNSDNTLIQKYLNWEPDTTLRAGLEKTYAWIYDQYMARERAETGAVRHSSATR